MTTNPAEPLISCLCLTRKRPEHLARAIQCFLAQTYGNKELVVVFPESDAGTAACLETFESAQIRPCPVTIPGATLGDLRNFSIERAQGELMCGWDDDDWYSPERLRRQHLALTSSKKSATVFARIFIYHAARQKAYLSCERLWENSVFFNKADIAEHGVRYPSLNKNEDYEFVNLLIKNNLVYAIYDPTSYIYNITGTNTSDTSNLDMLLKRASPLDEAQTALVRQAMELSASPRDVCEYMESREFKRPLRYFRHSTLARS
jgi:glycosyltransferase involved in cell wall biosynthesis